MYTFSSLDIMTHRLWFKCIYIQSSDSFWHLSLCSGPEIFGTLNVQKSLSYKY